MRRFIVPVGLVVAGIAVGLLVDPANERLAAAIFGAGLTLAIGWIAVRHWTAMRGWRRPLGLIVGVVLALLVGVLAIGSTASALVAVGVMPEPSEEAELVAAETPSLPATPTPTEVASPSPTATVTPQPTTRPTARPTPRPTPTPTAEPTATPYPELAAFDERIRAALPKLKAAADALIGVLDGGTNEQIDDATSDLFGVVYDEQMWVAGQQLGFFSCVDPIESAYKQLLARYERPTELVWESLPTRGVTPEDWASTVDASKFHVAEAANEADQLIEDLENACD